MRAEILLWAFLMPIGWRMVALLPLSAARDDVPVTGVLALGFLAATGLVLAVERRLPFARALRPPPNARPGLLLPAMIAGTGTLILASEIGNVVASIWPPSLPEGEPLGAGDPSWMKVALTGAVQPFTTALIFGVVLTRALRPVHRRRTVFVVAGMLGALLTAPLPQFWPQQAILLGLCAWVYLHSGSALLALAAHAPVAAIGALHVLGLGPGIDGFDVVPEGAVVFQPVWFNLLGAAAVAVGCGALIRAFEAPPDEPAASP